MQRTRRASLSGAALTCAALTGLVLISSGCSGDQALIVESMDEGALDAQESSPQRMDSAPFEVSVETDVAPETVAPVAPADSQGEVSPRGASLAGSSEGAATAPAAAEPAPSEPAAAPRPTMFTAGRQLLDTCGQPFVTRGVEQIFGNQLPQGNDWRGLLQQIADSGVNAVRILAGTDTLGTEDVDALLEIVADNQMVAYVTPYGNEATRWLERQPVRQMLARHAKYIIIDAFGEPTFDDRERFLADSTQTIRDVRSWGYEVPLTVTANQFGRDLPSLFELGSEIIAADPLNNTILGWQAYWGSNGYYQEHYGMSLQEAVDAVAEAPFPIQLGLDRITDFPSSQTADYGTLMSKTAQHGVGWLWWDWFNPYGNENNLTNDGSVGNLTATGSEVLAGHAASVEKTARRVCVR